MAKPHKTLHTLGRRFARMGIIVHQIGCFASGRRLMCEIETGEYHRAELFPPKTVQYAIRRLGLVQDGPAAASAVPQQAMVEPSRNARIAQLLISPDGIAGKNHLAVNVAGVRGFLRDRIRKDKDEKYRDRHFLTQPFFRTSSMKSKSKRATKPRRAASLLYCRAGKMARIRKRVDPHHQTTDTLGRVIQSPVGR
jgi:hypothetical protein